MKKMSTENILKGVNLLSRETKSFSSLCHPINSITNRPVSLLQKTTFHATIQLLELKCRSFPP